MAATFNGILNTINKELINPSLRFLLWLAIAVFVYGVLKIIMNPDNPDILSEGRRHVLWSLAGFVIMLLVFGIINLIKATLTP
ncbi:MAG: hypothetical protein AAB372_01185 [Patescibacteria group bacterium]